MIEPAVIGYGASAHNADGARCPRSSGPDAQRIDLGVPGGGNLDIRRRAARIRDGQGTAGRGDGTEAAFGKSAHVFNPLTDRPK